MKSLFTFLLAGVFCSIFTSSPALGGQFEQGYPAQAAIAGAVEIDTATPVVVASVWRHGGHHRHYGGHYGRGDPFFGKPRHRHGNSYYYRSGYFYAPYYSYYPYRPFYRGYYSPYGGPFGFSACFRSGGVRVCINDSYPYRYR